MNENQINLNSPKNTPDLNPLKNNIGLYKSMQNKINKKTMKN